MLYSRRNNIEASQAAFAEADRRYQQISNLEGITELTLQRGVAANRDNRYTDAAALLRQTMDHAREAGNLQQEISAKLTLANVSYKAGDSDQAQSLASEALTAAQANQLESLTIRGLMSLGAAQLDARDFPGAEKRFQDALDLAQHTTASRLAAQSRLNLASLYDQMDRSEDQIREATGALAYFQPNHWVQETFQALTLIGRGERHRGDYAAALDSFQRLLDESTKAQDQARIAQAEESLGDVLSDMESYPLALEHYQRFLHASAAAPQLGWTGYAERDCASTLSVLGRYAEALPGFDRADAATPKDLSLRRSIAQCRAEMALSRNQFREAIDAAGGALSGAGAGPFVAVELTRIMGLALVRSSDRGTGLRKCEAAYAAAWKLEDPGQILGARIALLEAQLAVRDSARATVVFHDLEPALAGRPESRWRAFALMARSDRQYADRAKEALGQLETLWGHDALHQYLTRPDLMELSRPFLQTSSAKH